jgi:hypothetical protein
MNAYFFNVTKEEKENILNKHKTLYDGYSVRNEVPNQQPLYTQDLANDKDGITVNSKGEVSKYNDKIYMKESSGECEECGYMEEDTDEGIYDVQDLSGEFDYVEETELDEVDPKELKKGSKYKYHSPTFEDEVEYQGDTEKEEDGIMHKFFGNKSNHLMGHKAVEKFIHDTDFNDEMTEQEGTFVPKSKMSMSEYLEDDTMNPEFKEKLKESLDMFKRFKNFN